MALRVALSTSAARQCTTALTSRLIYSSVSYESASLVQRRFYRPPASHARVRRPTESRQLDATVPAAAEPSAFASRETHNTIPLVGDSNVAPLPEVVNIPVRLPATDSPTAVLRASTDPTDSVAQIGGVQSVLAAPALVVTRQIEMMNILIGFEQANKYAIKDPSGQNVGFIAEDDQSFIGSIIRQFMRTRRSFKAVVLDRNGDVVLKIDRPIKWFLNSSITISDKNDTPIGEAKQVFHLWRRKYELFLGKTQYAAIDGEFWAWDFRLQDEAGRSLGSVNRNFVGFAREIFTDTGQYAIHMDSTVDLARPLSLDERAVMLATAINIDIDYFSRHSHSGGGWMPIPMFGMGGTGGTGSDLPTTTAPLPPVGSVGGVGGAPIPPVFIPGVGTGPISGEPSAGTTPSDSAFPSSPQPPVMPGDGTGSTNQWGENPFLSDEEAGLSSSEMQDTIGSVGRQVFKWFTGGDD